MILELVIVLAIILFIAQRALKVYFTKPVADKKVEEFAVDAGVNTANYQSIKESTKQKIEAIANERQKQMQGLGLEN